MKTARKKITTNTRVIKDLLTKYKDTFQAFKELINNSVQAEASKIEINIDYVNQADIKAPIKSIEIIDNGYGVSYNEFDKKILEIGTTVKQKGQGIGRFSALQIGELMHIETIGYDQQKNEFSFTKFGLDTIDFRDAQLEETEFNVDYEYFGNHKKNTFYKINIENLHHNKQEKIHKRNLISDKFLEQNIKQSIFENYPFQIFHNIVKFVINDVELKRSDFVIGKPSKKTIAYSDKKGKEHKIDFYFYNIKSTLNKVKVFYQTDNEDLKSVAHEYTYSSDWYTPDLGTWFIYVSSPFLNSDLFRNLDIENLGEEELKNLKLTVKEVINDFFKAKNKRFDKFLNSLENDKYYPYIDEKPASKTQEVLFKKVAYLLENEHRLIQKDDKIRDFLYPLLDKAISNGNIEFIFDKVLKLSDENIEKFHSLLQKTDLEDVVHFASKVSEKLEFLEFLHELTYGELSKCLKERSQLHKIIEKELWLFGESYNGTPNLWSDKKIGKILKEIRENHFNYKPNEKDENLIEIEGEGLNDITDLFFFNEKITDNDEREIMIVELKAPNCAISQKEIEQINRYAFTLEENSGLPNEKVNYKLILISSRLTKYAKSQAKSKRKAFPNKPFLFDVKTEKNIEVYVLEWSELMEQNRRKLGYLSSKLSIKDKSVKDKFEQEYSELIDEKISSQLRRV
ncbi:MAG: hypothetical protein COA97_09755 [Flavobacteriales bacterium]|nr:MAG: hypothetical protein COA97_09755 [Flavobacteriales bacterium]